MRSIIFLLACVSFFLFISFNANAAESVSPRGEGFLTLNQST